MSKDTDTRGPISGTEPKLPPSSDEPTSAGRNGFREPLGEDAVEQLRRYQVMTIPPSARRALLGAKLPGASPELLYDTLPPNLAVQHGDADAPLELEGAPAVPPTRTRVARAVALGFAATLLALSLLVCLARPSSQRAQSVSSPAGHTAEKQDQRPPLPTPKPDENPVSTAPQPATEAASAPPSTGAGHEKVTSSEKKSATASTPVPKKEPSHFATALPAGVSPAGTGSVHAPATDGAGSKNMRLGSR